MSLTSGQRLGHYEVVSVLGVGGMGEVYRARDMKLRREVALKVLPESLASDPDRLTRFQREATVLAALNHPNIAQVHGLEDSTGVPALIMELVEGPTLADRISSGKLAIDDALTVARQIAEALEAAHTAGIIHRDLKPANIKVRADGTVKVLDFGLAKAVSPAATSDASVSMSPTLSVHGTQAGIILGTAAYMSPEQARGKTADMRADIWAFGVVLFETLAGTRPFEGDEVSDTLAGILKSEPAWQLLPSDVPAVVRRLLRRCLQKDRRARLQHIGDARLDIEEAQQGPSSDSDVPQASSRQVRLAWASAIGFGVLAAIIAASAVYRRAPAVPELPEMRVDVSGPQGLFGSQFAISPDGRAIAFSTGDSQRRQIWVRSLDDPSPKPLAGTEGSEYPFWSPDSRSIGFFANNKLKRVDLDGGVQQLANVLTPAGGTWNRDGTILFVPNDSAGVMSVPATGGEARLVTPQREPRLATRLPQFLPDGRRFLFFVARGGEPAGVYVGELGSDSIRRVLAADRPAVYGSGHVWFVRDGDLFAQRFDATTLTLSGAVSRVAQNVGLGLVVASLSASATGPIAYRTVSEVQPQGGRRGLTWFDRTGKDLGRVGEEGGFASNPGMSADGRHVVMQRTVQENIDIWLLDLSRNVSSRLTDQPGIDSLPIWSPDGTRVAFSTQSAKRFGIAVLRIDRLAESEIVLSASPASGSSAEDVAGAKIACHWSPDGRLIMYKQVELNLGNTDLWVVPVSSPDKPVQLVATPADERDGQFSPDGKWIAYESNESGRPQIYVQPFPGPGRKVPISTGGGSQVRWRRDGKELFYIAPDDSLMAVAFDPTGQSDVGVPTPLFRTSIAPIRTISRQQYVVSSDGQRFLIVTSDAPLAVTPVTLLLNWKGVSP